MKTTTKIIQKTEDTLTETEITVRLRSLYPPPTIQIIIPPPPPPPAALPATPERLQDFFDAYDAAIVEHYASRFLPDAQAIGVDGHKGYNTELAIDGMVSAHKAGHPTALANAIALCDAMVAIDPWDSTRGQAGQSTLDVMQTAQALVQTAIAAGGSKDNYIERAFAEIALWDDNTTWSPHPTGKGNYWRYFWAARGYYIDTVAHFARMVRDVYNYKPGLLPAGRDWEIAAADCAAQFKTLSILQGDGSYLWDMGMWKNDNDPPHPEPGNINETGHLVPNPDSSHACRQISMVTALYRLGETFTLDDVLRYGVTFSERIWNGVETTLNPEDKALTPWYNNYIDGDDSGFSSTGSPLVFSDPGNALDGTTGGMNSNIYDNGWIGLAGFHEPSWDAALALFDFLQAFNPLSTNPIRFRNGSAWGELAISGHMALASVERAARGNV